MFEFERDRPMGVLRATAIEKEELIARSF